MNRAIAWFVSNHVAANLLMLFFVVGGAITAFTMKLEVFPETSLDKIAISVAYPGASPAEVEEAIIRRIEEKVAGLAGVRRIDSRASEGVGIITIEIMRGWELQKLLDEVKSEVDRITTLPDEAEKPVVREIVRRNQVLWVGVFGDVPESTLKHLAEKIKDDLTNIPGITLAELFGVRKGEITIEVSEETLRRHGLTLGNVAKAVRSASMDLPAGRIKTSAGEVLVRGKGKRYNAAEYADVPVITRTDGSKVTLGQLAALKDAFEDSDLAARFQGKPASLVQVYRVADQNALDVANKVKEYVASIRPTLPHGIDIDFFGDASIVLKDRLELLLRNMALGLILVVVVLGLFLNVKLALWVTMGIPISFFAGIWFLPSLDVSINMISLFAFILVLGIVVDDAIVVGENIFKKREEGMGRLEAAVAGAQEVGPPVVFSVLTTVAAFVPLLLGTGMMGKIMRNIPVVISVVLIGSLLESLFVLPVHLSRSRIKLNKRRKEKAASRWLKSFISGPYTRILSFCLRWRYATFSAGLALLLLAFGIFTGGWVKFTLFPKVESDTLQAGLTMPAGTPVERTTQVVAFLEKSAQKALGQADKERAPGADPLLTHTVSLIGARVGGRGPHGGTPETGGHQASIFVQLLEGEKRDKSALELNARWRRESGEIPEAESVNFQGELFMGGSPVEVHLSSDDKPRLMRLVQELKSELRAIPGVFEVSDSFSPGKVEMQLKLKPSARSLGLTLSDLATQVRHAFYGAEALRLQKGQDEVKVMVRYPEKDRKSLSDIERMRIRTPAGKEVPFSEVAQVSMVEGYATIERAQRRRVVKVMADVDEKVTNANEVRQNLEKTILPRLMRKYSDIRYDMEGEAREQRESMADIQQGFILALCAIYVLLAIPFRSFSQPFIIMCAIPFGVVGAILGHLIMGLNLSLLSLFGIVGLSGVVVNDSLLLIHTTNRLREEGLSALEAVRKAGPLRFRPVILTSVTTFAGLTPIIFERSLQAQFLIPMAVSLGFGVLFATGITLLLIPCGYGILNDFQTLVAKIKTAIFGDPDPET